MKAGGPGGLQRPRSAGGGNSVVRLVFGVGLLVAAVGLVLVLTGKLLESEPAREEPVVVEVDEPEPDLRKGLKVRATDPVKVRVELDGKLDFVGVMCTEGVHACVMEWPAAREIAVEVADLTRAAIYYDGREISPLGNLSSRRRLVFVDDS